VQRFRSVHSISDWMRALHNLPTVRWPNPFSDVILDACYEQVREAAVIASQAVLIAIGTDWNGRGPSAHGRDPWGQVVAIELADHESRSSYPQRRAGSVSLQAGSMK
jgi:hypothetical protein